MLVHSFCLLAVRSKIVHVAVSRSSQKRNAIAGRMAAKWQKIASNRFLPRIWLQKASARIWLKMAVSPWSQKALLVAGPQAAKVPQAGSKRLRACEASKNTFLFSEFFAPRLFKKHENTNYLTIFRLYKWRLKKMPQRLCVKMFLCKSVSV